MQHIDFAGDMGSHCLGVRVGRLHRLVSRLFDAELRPLGLTLPQLEVLTALVSEGGLRPGDLADWLAVERSTMSRNLAGLEGRGLVRTTERSATGRTMRVEITDAGRDLHRAAESAWRSAQARATEAMGEGAVGSLDAWLAGLGATVPAATGG